MIGRDVNPAAVVTEALTIFQCQHRAEQDARILETTGDYGDFDGLEAHVVVDD